MRNRSDLHELKTTKELGTSVLQLQALELCKQPERAWKQNFPQIVRPRAEEPVKFTQASDIQN